MGDALGDVPPPVRERPRVPDVLVRIRASGDLLVGVHHPPAGAVDRRRHAASLVEVCPGCAARHQQRSTETCQEPPHQKLQVAIFGESVL